VEVGVKLSGMYSKLAQDELYLYQSVDRQLSRGAVLRGGYKVFYLLRETYI